MSKANNKRWWLGGLLVVAVGGLIFFALNIKYRDIEVNIGPAPEARHNPYLAAQMLMTELYQPEKLETQQGFALLSDMPSTEDALIIDGTRSDLGKLRTQKLIDWIEQGGHLVVNGRAQTSDTNQDLLLAHFGVDIKVYESSNESDENDNETSAQSQSQKQVEEQVTPSEEKSVEQLLTQESQQYTYKCRENSWITELKMPSVTGAMNVDIHSYNVMFHEDAQQTVNFSGDDGYGIQILQLAVGQGKLTVMTDMRLWRNNEIACYDNAYLLSALIKDSRKAYLLYYESLPGIIELLWQNARNLILSAAVLLLLWIWSQTLRFGPLRQDNQSIRRNYLEHLAAAARYRWYSGESQALIDLLRNQIMHKLALRHSDIGQLNEQQQSAFISHLSEMNEAVVFHAMFDAVPQKPEKAIKMVQHLQQLRKHLC